MSLLKDQSLSTRCKKLETLWNKNVILPVYTKGITAGKVIAGGCEKNLSFSILIVLWISLSNDLIGQLASVYVHKFLVGLDITC